MSYETGTDRAVAAAVLMDLASLDVIESAVFVGQAQFPYIPGLLSFREAPLLLAALKKLEGTPDVLVCDGHGIAHPRRFGLACHIGVETGIPTFGVAKNRFGSATLDPGPLKGRWSVLLDGDDTVGRVLRTQNSVKPVFVSIGHRINLEDATEITLDLCPRFRIPEVIRKADSLSRQEIRSR